MPMIPAFCDLCGTPFSSGIFVENCRNISLSGNKSGPCPSCGGIGSVPDGVFNVIGDVIEILNAPVRTVSQLQSYVQLLRAAKEQNLSGSELRREIDEKAPELSSIGKFLPKTPADLFAFLTVLISLLTYITSLTKDKEVSNDDLERMMDKAIERMLLHQENEVLRRENERLKTQEEAQFPRNSQCPCGSGQRFKRCCGKLI